PLARLTALAEGLHSTSETATCQIPRAEQAFRDAHLTGTSKRRRLCPSRPAPARSKIAGVGARHGGFAVSNSGLRGRSTRRILDNFLRAWLDSVCRRHTINHSNPPKGSLVS